MRVMLLSVPRSGFPILFPSLSVATLVSHLKSKSITVTADDVHIRMFHHARKKGNSREFEILEDVSRLRRFLAGDEEEQLSTEIRKAISLIRFTSPDVIGLSFPESTEQSVFLGDAIAKILKEDLGVVTVAGGDIGPVVEYLSKSENIDYVFLPGEGEVPLANLMESLDSRRDVSTIPRILSHDMRGPEKNEPLLSMRPDEFTPPDFSEFPLDLFRFTYDIPGIEMEPVLLLPYRFVKNCVFNCAFCSYSESPLCFVNSPSLVAEHLSAYCKDYGTHDFVFFNTSVNVSREYTSALVAAFEEYDLNINWVDCLNFMTLDPHMLFELQKIGLRRAIIGLECPSEHILRAINKPLRLSLVETLLRRARELGVWIELDFISGLPYETEKDIQCTIDFIRNHLHEVSLFHLSRFKMIRSRYLAKPKEYGLRIHEAAPGQDLSHGHPFDELAGFPWREKQNQIESSFRRVKAAIPLDQEPKGKNIPMSVLYLLNKHLHPKEDMDLFKSVVSSFPDGNDERLIPRLLFKGEKKTVLRNFLGAIQ